MNEGDHDLSAGRRLAIAAFGLITLVGPSPAGAQAAGLDDPFGTVAVHQFANGLTLWYRQFPGVAGTSLSLTIPAGSDLDPVGREELAHVVEHALFAPRAGRTQAEITGAITDLGGSFNAATSPDRTILWVSVAREHTPLAIDWLYGLLAPRVWHDSILPAAREAVALELGLAPRSLLARLRDDYLRHPSLLPPGFWQREFGLAVPEYRGGDRFAALQRIGAADIAAFQRAHHVPARMILLVSGDVPAGDVVARVGRTFGQLPAWPSPPPEVPHRLKRDATRRYLWNLRDDVALQLAFRLDSLTAADHLRLLFTRELLERRLLRRLRWGREQSVYGARAEVVRRGPVALLQVETRTTPAELATVRSVLADELQRLRHGRYPPGEFEQDRTAMERSLRLNLGTPSALRVWHASTFYDPTLHPSPPPLADRFAAMTTAELADFARRRLAPERETLTVRRPLPLGGPGAFLLLLAAALSGVAAARRWLLRPIPMTRLRYLARLRPPVVLHVLGTGLIAAILLVLGRLFAAGVHVLGETVVVPRESLLLQAGFLLAAVALGVFLLTAALSLVPRRLLVFEHELRIKYLAYRSTPLPPSQLIEVKTATFAEVWLDRRLWRTVPLAFGWRRPALLIRTRHGPDWFISVRDNQETAAAASHLAAAPARD